MTYFLAIVQLQSLIIMVGAACMSNTGFQLQRNRFGLHCLTN